MVSAQEPGRLLRFPEQPRAVRRRQAYHGAPPPGLVITACSDVPAPRALLLAVRR